MIRNGRGFSDCRFRPLPLAPSAMGANTHRFQSGQRLVDLSNRLLFPGGERVVIVNSPLCARETIPPVLL